MTTLTTHRWLTGVAIAALAAGLLLSPNVFGHYVAGAYWAYAPYEPQVGVEQHLPGETFAAQWGYTEGDVGNQAEGAFYVNLATGFLGTYVSAYDPHANLYGPRGGSAEAVAAFSDGLHCVVPAGIYADGLYASLHGLVAGRLSAEGCDGVANPRCSNAYHIAIFAFAHPGVGSPVIFDERWDVDSMTSPVIINSPFSLTVPLVPPGTTLADDEVKNLIVQASLETRGAALGLYPYGDVVSAMDGDFYDTGGFTQLELPHGVVCSSDSGVFLSEPGGDVDADGISASADNCTEVFNPDQRDTNGDGIGSVCDADITNDCSVNFGDLAVLKAAFTPGPYDPDADFDGDGFVNFGDLAKMKSTFFNGANPGPGPSGLPNPCGP